jgi:hypothetical protein
VQIVPPGDEDFQSDEASRVFSPRPYTSADANDLPLW